MPTTEPLAITVGPELCVRFHRRVSVNEQDGDDTDDYFSGGIALEDLRLVKTSGPGHRGVAEAVRSEVLQQPGVVFSAVHWPKARSVA
jgi:hypothetical protein